MVQFLGRYNLTFCYHLPIQLVKGPAWANIHFRVTYSELAKLTNVGVQIDKIHITDFFLLLYAVVCYRGLGSTSDKASRIFF
jgi:hypothetical protein